MRLGPPVGLHGYWTALKASFAQVSKNNLSLIAAGVAFFSMLSLFPAIAALIALFGLLADPAVVIGQLQNFRGLMPEEMFEIINDQVVGLVSTSSGTLGWAGILSVSVALWSARAGVGAMINGLNAVYSERNRGSIRHSVAALGITLGLMGVGIVALIMVVVAPLILAFIPLGWFVVLLADVLRWTIAVGIILAGIGLLYRYGPNRRKARAAWLTPGALLAVVSWAAVSLAFTYYVANFGKYNEVYGSIGAVIAMLIWLWITSFLVLFGAALNAELELLTSEDSTVGKARPMGQRGAYAADRVIRPDG